jgi:pimeloyl-ACP methyl ester carboxylesterase
MPLTIDGVQVHVEGNTGPTVVMLHGWPDTYRLWDDTVHALQKQFRCVRFSLPGFDLEQPERTPSLADLTRTIGKIVDAVSPDSPVTLLLHDWGCTFGYEYQARNPQRVARIIAVDIGDHNTKNYRNSLSGRAKWQIFGYQFWLALAWKMGHHASPALAQWMTRFMVRRLHIQMPSHTPHPTNPPNPPNPLDGAHAAPTPAHPRPAEALGWQMNYPYAMLWFGLQGGLRGCAKVKPICPVLFIYGQNKPFMFHSPQWLVHLSQSAGSRWQAMPTGHWVMRDDPQAFLACIQNWLGAGNASLPKA